MAFAFSFMNSMMDLWPQFLQIDFKHADSSSSLNFVSGNKIQTCSLCYLSSRFFVGCISWNVLEESEALSKE